MSSSSEEDEEKDVNIMDSGEEEAALSRVNNDSFLSADFSTQMTDMSLDADTCKYDFILRQFH